MCELLKLCVLKGDNTSDYQKMLGALYMHEI